MDLKKEISERLITFREKILGIRKQQDMAKILEIPPSTYGKYENGVSEPSFEILQRLSDKGCDLHWLITGKSPPQSPAAPSDGNMKQCLDIIQQLVEENKHLQKNIEETKQFRVMKNGTDNPKS